MLWDISYFSDVLSSSIDLSVYFMLLVSSNFFIDDELVPTFYFAYTATAVHTFLALWSLSVGVLNSCILCTKSVNKVLVQMISTLLSPSQVCDILQKWNKYISSACRVRAGGRTGGRIWALYCVCLAEHWKLEFYFCWVLE